MPFFQNPFANDFEGNWLLSDRQYTVKFVAKSNAGRGKEMVYAWTAGPYNLSGNDPDGNPRKYLSIIYRLHNTKNWATLKIDLTGYASSASAVTIEEVVTALQSNTVFSERFIAQLGSFDNKGSARTVVIRQKKPCTELEFYIKNGQAEVYLGFNARAGVAELPTYFAMHTIENRFNFVAGEGRIIMLNPVSSTVDSNLIDNAKDALGNSMGYDHNLVQEDWQLLRGRSGIFNFTKGPSTSAVTSTETVITYPAGAKTGDLALKTITRKDTNSIVVESFQMPYTLTASDLIVPPDVFNQTVNPNGLMGAGSATVTVA